MLFGAVIEGGFGFGTGMDVWYGVRVVTLGSWVYVVAGSG